jgi:DNA-binding transcriptional ArsR family regulator
VERLSRENGLLLVATLDALFDCGLISFRDDGQMVISKSVSVADQKRLMLKGRRRINKKLSRQQRKYTLTH